MLTVLIRNYRAGLTDFNSNSPQDTDAANAYAAMTFQPPLEAIREFDGPAASLDEALLALDQAQEELANGDIDTAEALISAARLYLREVCVG